MKNKYHRMHGRTRLYEYEFGQLIQVRIKAFSSVRQGRDLESADLVNVGADLYVGKVESANRDGIRLAPYVSVDVPRFEEWNPGRYIEILRSIKEGHYGRIQNWNPEMPFPRAILRGITILPKDIASHTSLEEVLGR